MAHSRKEEPFQPPEHFATPASPQPIRAAPPPPPPSAASARQVDAADGVGMELFASAVTTHVTATLEYPAEPNLANPFETGWQQDSSYGQEYATDAYATHQNTDAGGWNSHGHEANATGWTGQQQNYYDPNYAYDQSYGQSDPNHAYTQSYGQSYGQTDYSGYGQHNEYVASYGTAGTDPYGYGQYGTTSNDTQQYGQYGTATGNYGETGEYLWILYCFSPI